MSEGIELPESHHEHGDNPFVLPVSLTVSIMAVLLATVSLLSHRAHTESLRFETRAASRWTQYQAKSIRLHEAHGFSDVVNLVASMDKENGEKLKEKYAKEVEHYESDKEDVSNEAKKLEDERDLAGNQADKFDAGAEFLAIGLVICSITLLTKQKAFWFVGMLVGSIGVVLAVMGFTIH
jgi:uncharacterized protein DUF4337